MTRTWKVMKMTTSVWRTTTWIMGPRLVRHLAGITRMIGRISAKTISRMLLDGLVPSLTMETSSMMKSIELEREAQT